MFLHNFKYEFLNLIRQKDIMFWMMCFPFILATFFYMAFGNLYEKDDLFKEIPVAVVEQKSDDTFKTVISEVSTGSTNLFKTQFTDKEKALKLLEDEKITGIIYVDDDITLSVSSTGIEQTIIKSFLEQYKMQETIITQTAKNDPTKLQSVITALSQELNSNVDIKYTKNEIDPYAQFFHNLIAMVALLGMTTGIVVATANQANLSAIGARKSVSPTLKLKSILASLSASYLIQLLSVSLSITYINFILNIDIGDRLGFVYLGGALGSLLGVSMGFFLGAIGKMSESAKVGISISISMFLCFLSGLMMGNIKAIIEMYCPILNKINPAAVVSNLFYCLSIYDDLTRYMENVITILIMTVAFIIGGFLLTRRRKYASI